MSEKKTVIGEYQEQRRHAREFIKSHSYDPLIAEAKKDPAFAARAEHAETASQPLQAKTQEMLDTANKAFNKAVYDASYAMHRHAPLLQAIDEWSCDHIGAFVPSSCQAVKDAGVDARVAANAKKER